MVKSCAYSVHWRSPHSKYQCRASDKAAVGAILTSLVISWYIYPCDFSILTAFCIILLLLLSNISKVCKCSQGRRHPQNLYFFISFPSHKKAWTSLDIFESIKVSHSYSFWQNEQFENKIYFFSKILRKLA